MISLQKQLVGVPTPSVSGTAGNYDVVYEFVIENDGTTPLDNITLTEDIAAQFGGAFVATIGTPTITASTAATDPTVNASFDGGTSDAQIFDGVSGLLETNQTITVQITVEVDPDNATAIYDGLTGDGNSDLENSATTSGTDPQDPTDTPVSDTSDDPTDPTDTDGDPADPGNTADDDNEPDDPVSLFVPDITLNKTLAGAPVPATSGAADNYDVTFDLEIINTGNEPLNTVTLAEDLTAQYGGAFVQIVGTPVITASTATDTPELNVAYDGGATDAQLFDNSAPNTNLLLTDESVTVQIVVEIDPDAAGAIWTNGTLENQATTTGVGENTGLPVDDLSDDPNDVEDVDGDPADPADDDNNPDDPTGVRLQNITLEKTLTATPVPAASGTQGNFDATYEFVIENDGATPLQNITLTEDLATQFGGAFIGVVTPPSITASTATTDPTLNAGWDGSGDVEIFDGVSGYLEANETITVQITVEIDPDNPAAIYDSITGDGNTDLENQATTSGTDPGDPTNTPVTDDSDDPTDPTNDDGNRNDPSDDDGDPDDPVSLFVPDITLEKTTVGTPVVASSGTAGNFDVTYQFVLTNTGNDDLTNLSLVEDFAAQFGGAFVGLAGTPAITASTATDIPELNAAYDGGFLDGELFDNSGLNTNLLAPGQTVTVQLVAEVNLDAAGAILTGLELENQATTSGDGLGSGLSTSDGSDDTNVTTNVDPDGDNNPDDPTIVGFPSDASIGVAKEGNFVSPTEARYTYRMEHFGDAQAVNLTMPDNLDDVFGAGNYSVAPPVLVSGPASLGTNAAYNGGSITELLATGSYMSPGDTAEIEIVVTINTYADPQGNGLGVYENEVTLAGENPYGDPVSDDSTDGNTPGAGGSGTETVIVAAFADVSGTVYVDANGDGDLNPGESGIIGVTITLTGTDSFGNPVSLTRLTDADGFYSFEDLLPGNYTITQSHPTQFIDGDDNIGTLGGGTTNDQFTLTIPFGSDGSFENDFGERGLRPEFISKALLLSSTPEDYWASINASGSGTLGVWVPFDVTEGGAVNAVLLDADGMQVDIFDSEMNPLNPARETAADSTWVVHEGEQYFARLTGEDPDFDFGLAFGSNAELPVSVEIDNNVAMVVATVEDDNVELTLGHQTHLLSMAGYDFEFDATIVDTIHIGGGQGWNAITVHGTDHDDVGEILARNGKLISDAYTIGTWGFDETTLVGGGGNDYTQIYGSTGADNLQALPQDSTITMENGGIAKALEFERVDSYGRGGYDYGSMYGTNDADEYYTFDTYEVLRSLDQSMVMRTVGWDRVDAFGRHGDDVAYVYDTPGDDHFWSFNQYFTMVTDHLLTAVKGFESVIAEAKEGGTDTFHVRQVEPTELGWIEQQRVVIEGLARSVDASGFDLVDDPAEVLPASVASAAQQTGNQQNFLDVDGDGVVQLTDFLAFAQQYGEQNEDDDNAMTQEEVVDILMAHFGQGNF